MVTKSWRGIRCGFLETASHFSLGIVSIELLDSRQNVRAYGGIRLPKIKKGAMQARKSAIQCAHPCIAAALVSCTLSFTTTLAQAQASASTERDAAEQMQGQGSQQESGHANVLNVGQLNINAAKVNVPLAQSLQQLTQQPGMDYLNQLLNAPQLQGKVNWSAVELAHQHWDYDQQGLTPAGAAIVAIVVAYFTAGAASGVGASAAEGAGFATTTAAGTTVMATTAGTVVAGATTAAAALIDTGAAQGALAIGELKDAGTLEGPSPTSWPMCWPVVRPVVRPGPRAGGGD